MKEIAVMSSGTKASAPIIVTIHNSSVGRLRAKIVDSSTIQCKSLHDIGEDQVVTLIFERPDKILVSELID